MSSPKVCTAVSCQNGAPHACGRAGKHGTVIIYTRVDFDRITIPRASENPRCVDAISERRLL